MAAMRRDSRFKLQSRPKPSPLRTLLPILVMAFLANVVAAALGVNGANATLLFVFPPLAVLAVLLAYFIP